MDSLPNIFPWGPVWTDLVICLMATISGIICINIKLWFWARVCLGIMIVSLVIATVHFPVAGG